MLEVETMVLGSIDQLNNVGNEKLSYEAVERLGLQPYDDQCYYLSKDNPFRAVLTRNQQLKWNSHKPVDAVHVAEVMDFSESNRRFLHINTGTHGDKNGYTVEQNISLADGRLTKGDFESVCNSSNMSLHIVSQGAAKLEGKDYTNVDIIDAWCFSAKSQSAKDQAKDLRKFLHLVAERWNEKPRKTEAHTTIMGSTNKVVVNGGDNIVMTGVNANDINVTMNK